MAYHPDWLYEPNFGEDTQKLEAMYFAQPKHEALDQEAKPKAER
jgi:hypothetical protein